MTVPSSDVVGRRVVITGATGSLGRVAAHAFAERGASLALISSDQAKLDVLADTLAHELALPSTRALTYAANLRSAAAARAAAQVIADTLGGADCLLHLVGGWVGGKEIVETNPDDLAAMLDQHVWTTFNALQAFVPLLAASGKGRVVVVSSPVVTHAQRRSGPYAAAKAAEEQLVLTLAQEVSGKGITANVIQVNTIDASHQREQAPTPTNASWTTPEEIVAALLYLCSDAGAALNGARLSLAGRRS